MKTRTKKAFAWLMTFAMLLSLLPAAGLTALAAEGDVTYRVPTYVGNDPAKGISEWKTETKATGEYTAISESNKPTRWDKEWYVVTGTVSIEGSVTVSGNVNLILADGASLTISGVGGNGGGIRVIYSNSLTIYGQSEGNSKGELTVTGGKNGAGIGGEYGVDGGNITINGGSVTATGGNMGAGIGGGNQKDGSDITINGGSVTANGGNSGAGIGGGLQGSGSNITINGGSVTATGGNMGAGIGGGNQKDGSDITINGGSVTANGAGKNVAGIGNGNGCETAASNIKIATTLTVKADGNNPPTTVIPNDGNDLADSLKESLYVKVEKGVGHTHSDTEMSFETKLTADGGELSSGSYYLDSDLTLTNNLTIPSGATVNLCLNGHVLKGTGTGSVITNSGTLNIYDCNGTTKHYFTVGSDGLWAWSPDETSGTEIDDLTARPETGTVIAVPGGCITGGNWTGTERQYGGGVTSVGESTCLTLKNVNIIGNAGDLSAGSVLAQGCSKAVNISGGIFAGCTTNCNGGAVYIREIKETNSTITGTKIMFNTSKECGGGIAVYNTALTIKDATIRFNKGSYGGGVGIHKESGGNTSLSISGTVVIKDNKSGETVQNVYLPSGKTITVDTPQTGMSIGVTLASGTGNVTGSNSADYSSYFQSDNTAYSVINSGEGAAQVVKLDKLQISVTGTKVDNKEYDGTTTATATLGTVSGIKDGDDVTVTPVAEFEDANAGEDKNVTVTYALSGTAAGKYIAPAGETLKANITKAKVEVPTAQSYTYDGDKKTALTIADNDPYELQSGTLEETNAGGYSATIALKDTANYEWNLETPTSDSQQITWSIAKASVKVPTAEADLVYTGKVQTGVPDGTLYTFVDDSNKATVAGSYTATAQLKDKDNYQWKDGDSENQEISWSIAKAEVEVPTAVEGTLTYNGIEQTGVVLPEGAVYTLTDNTATNAGSYTATAQLNSKDNYEWKGKATSDNQTIAWSIGKRSVTLYSKSDAKTFDGSPLTAAGVYGDEAKTKDVDSVFAGDVATLKATGTITNVGETNNTISYTFKSEDSADNYEISKNEGTLKINRSGEMSLTNSGCNVPYDGEAHGIAAEPSVETETTVSYQTSTDNARWSEYSATIPQITDAGTLYVRAKAENPNYEDATCEYTLIVTPAKVTVPTAVTGLVYSGEELTGVILPEDAVYTLENNTGTDVTDYQATATLKDTNHVWDLGDDATSAENQTIDWSIAKYENNAITNLTCANVKIGETPAPSAEVKFGEITYSYSKDGKTWGDWASIYSESGEYQVKAFVEGTDNYNACESEKPVTFRVGSVCEGWKIVKFDELNPGQYKMYLNNTDTGVYNFAMVVGGYTIQDATTEEYLCLENGKIVKEKTTNPTVWAKGIASFHASAVSTGRWGFSTCYYLNVDRNGNMIADRLPGITHFATYVEADEHEYCVHSNGNGTHTHTCIVCGDSYEETCTPDRWNFCTECGGYVKSGSSWWNW